MLSVAPSSWSLVSLQLSSVECHPPAPPLPSLLLSREKSQSSAHSLLGAGLHPLRRTGIVSNLAAKLQCYRCVTLIHCQDGHLVLGGALDHSQRAKLGLKPRATASALS